jgi:murein endopeptidase
MIPNAAKQLLAYRPRRKHAHGGILFQRPVGGAALSMAQMAGDAKPHQLGASDLIRFLENLALKCTRPAPGTVSGRRHVAAARRADDAGHASHQVGLDADIWLTPMPITG